MEDNNYKILLIEDNPDDAELMKRRLAKSPNARFTVTAVRTLREALAQLERDMPDLIISDLGLPDSHGLDTVRDILSKAPRAPLVVLSGFDDEATAIKAVKAGAQDYIVKGQLEGIYMERSLFYAMERSRMQRELEEHAQEILSIQTNLLKILEKNADAIIVVDEGSKILFTNPAVETLMGKAQQELINKPFDYPLNGGKTTEIEIERPDKARTIAEMRVVDISWEGNKAYLASLRNMTERKKAEEALRESEEKFSKAFRSSPEAIVIARLSDGKILDANDTFLETAGYTREEVIGNKSTELDVWSAKNDRLKMVKTLREKGEVRNEEHILRDKSGELRTKLFSAQLINIGDEQCVLSVTIDITERKEAEKALRESEEKFSKVFRSSPEVIVLTRLSDGMIMDANDTFICVSGYTREEVINKKMTELGVWANPEDRAQMVKMLQEKGEVRNIEYLFRMKSGEIRIWIFSAEIATINNEPCILSVTTDITERKKAEEALKESEEKFSKVFSTSANAVGITSLKTNFFIEANESFSRFTGYPHEEIIGRNTSDLNLWVKPEELKQWQSKLKAKGRVSNMEFSSRTKTGEIRIGLASAEVINISDEPCRIIVITDITERKKTEEALEESENKYKTLFESTAEGILAADIETMKFKYANPAICTMLGYSQEELIKMGVTDIHPKASLEQILVEFAALARGEEATSSSLPCLKKDGTVLYADVNNARAIIDGRECTIGFFIDITERKKAEEKLREIDKMKTEFLSNVSHELRTPLQSIGGFTKLIMNGQVPDAATQHEFLEIIDREALHLGNLINSLLDMSRLEAGRFQVNRRLAPVRDYFIDPVKSFYSLARDKNITLSESIPSQLPEMEVDGDRLRQVVINLVGNAIKFSDPGGSVSVKVEKQKDELLFQVSDNGIGISEEAKAHLFERFFRAEGEMVRGGTGLGLYISKQIIEAHGGSIRADSKLGQGSTFSFVLPLNSEGEKGNGKENPGH